MSEQNDNFRRVVMGEKEKERESVSVLRTW